MMILRCVPFLIIAASSTAQSVWTLRATPAHTGTYRPAGKPGVYLIPTGEVNDNDGTQIYLRSVDGILWSRVTLPEIDQSDTSRATLICLNGKFIGLSSQRGVWTSADGLSHSRTYTQTGQNFQPRGAAFGNEKWIVTLGNGDVLWSEDNAASWERIVTPASVANDIAFGNGFFIIKTGNASILSAHGITWSVGPKIEGENLCYAAGRFRTTERYSTSGVSWLPASMPGGGFNLRAGDIGFLTWGNFDPEPLIYESTPSGTWGPPTGSGVLNWISDLSYCGNLWIAVTVNGKVITSPAPPVESPALNITPAVRLSWQSMTGRSYLIQRSANQTTWIDQASMLGTGAVMEWFAPASQSREFFRVQVK